MKKLTNQGKGGARVWVLISFPLLLVFFSGTMWTQQPDTLKMINQYTDATKHNLALMRQYSWKMRVQLTLKGEVKAQMLYQMRFTMDGKLQKTLLSAFPKQKKNWGLFKRIVQKKIAQTKEWIVKIMGVHRRYTTPGSAAMCDFFSKAKYKILNDGTVQYSTTRFLQVNDRAAYWFDHKSHLPRRIKFSSDLEGVAVEGRVEYSNVDFGPAYISLSVLKVPDKKMSVKIENFDFKKQ